MSSSSVFVSYRPQSSAEHARAIFLNLLRHGFDVFMAPEAVPEALVLGQIAARAHFVLVLAPDTLAECAAGGERVCREVERALATGRRVVLVTMGGFELPDAAHDESGLLAQLAACDVVALHYERFSTGMAALHAALRADGVFEGDLSPAPPEDAAQAADIVLELEEAPPPAPSALALEEHFAAGAHKRSRGDPAGAVLDYSAAIALDPGAPLAYALRGRAYGELRELSAAIADLSRALDLDPDLVAPRCERGLALYHGGDFAAAIADLSEVIRRDPARAEAFQARGLARWEQGALADAEADLTRALQLAPSLLSALASRAQVRRALGDWAGARRDDEAHRVQSGIPRMPDLPGSAPLTPPPPADAAAARGGFWRRLLHREDYAAPDELAPGRAVDAPQTLPEEAVVMRLSDSDTPSISPLDDTVQGDFSPYLTQDNSGERGERSATRRLAFGLRSHVGQVRPNNQDAVFGLICAATSSHNLPACGLFIVADGMGGHEEGEKASAFAVDVMVQEIVTHGLLPLFQGDQQAADPAALGEALRAAAQHANRAVAEHVPGGGTTLTAAVIVGGVLCLAHIGDTRAYLVSEGGIEQLTRDHSLVQRMVELGQLTPGEAAAHNQRNVLYRALGQDEIAEVDLVVRPLAPRASLLLCSDGLWGLVEDRLLLEIVEDAASPQAACDLLIERANALGGPDNISALLARLLN